MGTSTVADDRGKAARAARFQKGLAPMIVKDALETVAAGIGFGAPRGTRRVHRTPGHAHIEVHGVHRPGMDHVVAAVEGALRDIDGVEWAQLNAALAEVVVAFDEGAVDVDDLVDAVDAAEALAGVAPDDVPPDLASHPADAEAQRLRVVEIAADVAGIALGVGVRAMRLPRLPVELAAALPALDAIPPVRRALETRRDLEAAFVSTSAVVQGLAQGPASLLVDATHRTLLWRESSARRQAWERAEARVHANAETTAAVALARVDRPEPLPDGWMENYARGVALGSLGAGLGVLALARNPRRSADLMLAAIPRGARLGREAFSAHATCVLSARDVVVMDPRVLRRLDRVDTVVVASDVLDAPAPALAALLDAVRGAAQDLVIATDDGTPVPAIDADLNIRGGTDLAESIRTLQAEGRVVAVVTCDDRAALAAADCGVGVHRGLPPWGAHVICPSVFEAALVVDATALARTATRRVVGVTAGGSAVAAVLALGPGPGAGRRTVLASNASALVSMATGVWTATTLSGRRVPPPDADEQVPWHALTTDDVMQRVGTGPAGLPPEEVAARRTTSAEPQPPGLSSLVVAELKNPLTALLAASGAFSTVTGSITDGLLVTGVLGMNALVGGVQRLQTERAIAELASSVSARIAHVRRGGNVMSVPAPDVVEGDMLVLHAGDVVPADARLVSSNAIEADESALTGESMPVAKDRHDVAAGTAVAERASMVYAGTAIAAGRAEAVVVATGDRTEARRGLAGHEHAPATGVEARLDALSRRTVPLVLAAGGVLTGSAWLRRVPMREAVATGVSLVAAAVPEGLPFLATVAQSAAARRLSAHGVLVRNARVLEALGRADVLCFDKTGTLTEGRLHLTSVSDGDTTDTMPVVAGARRAVLAAALRATPRRRHERLPHATDQAIVDAARALDVDQHTGASGWRKTVSLPFESRRGYHAVLGTSQDSSLLSVKGAPEIVLPRSEWWRRGDRLVRLDDAGRHRLTARVERFAAAGLRVLAVAERPASGREDLDEEAVDQLEFLGFVTVADVTRSSAAAPISRLQHAGIHVIMLTGDHPRTAAAIGEELGLVNGAVITGTQVDEMSDEQLDDVMRHATVFARVTPAHKVRIVKAYQRLGRVVAMTGDGANDAQAIRLADIGVALGPHATPAARAAADLVIVDDRVETLITAIVEGRAMWASVRDALAMLLGGNLGEVIFTTGAGLVAGRSPLNTRQLLAVNLLTDLAPALALALQRPRSGRIDLRRVGPETSLGAQLTREIAVRAVATASAASGAWTVARFTGTRTRAGTVALGALVGAQLGQTLATGYRSPLVVASSVVSAGALVAMIQTPGVSQFFGCRPLGPAGWAIAGTAAGLATAGAAVASTMLAPHGESSTIDAETAREIDLRGDEHGDHVARAIAGS